MNIEATERWFFCACNSASAMSLIFLNLIQSASTYFCGYHCGYILVR
ncbi:hypothetical protein M2386_001653 [Erwinia rhapontici]|nr:hypothetical protein [Erwinia rhapontici]